MNLSFSWYLNTYLCLFGVFVKPSLTILGVLTPVSHFCSLDLVTISRPIQSTILLLELTEAVKLQFLTADATCKNFGKRLMVMDGQKPPGVDPRLLLSESCILDHNSWPFCWFIYNV